MSPPNSTITLGFFYNPISNVGTTTAGQDQFVRDGGAIFTAEATITRNGVTSLNFFVIEDFKLKMIMIFETIYTLFSLPQ